TLGSGQYASRRWCPYLVATPFQLSSLRRVLLRSLAFSRAASACSTRQYSRSSSSREISVPFFASHSNSSASVIRRSAIPPELTTARCSSRDDPGFAAAPRAAWGKPPFHRFLGLDLPTRSADSLGLSRPRVGPDGAHASRSVSAERTRGAVVEGLLRLPDLRRTQRHDGSI